MLWRGVGLALGAACAHSAIDVIRKHASASIPSDSLVTLVAIVDAGLATSVVLAKDGFGDLDLNRFHRPGVFVTAVLCSSILLLLAKFGYQKALTLSPLSLTVPYLSITPAVLLLTAYVLVGETPSAFGICGVTIVAFGGYLLSLKNTSGASKLLAVEPAESAVAHIVHPCKPPLPLAEGPVARASSCPAMAHDIEAQQQQSAGLDIKRKPLKETKPSSLASALGLHRSACACLGYLRQEPGTALMIGVSVTWAVTASLDKVGVLHAPSIWVYFALQRLVIGALSLGFQLSTDPRAFSYFLSKPLLLISISVLELLAVLLFLEAIKYVMVSYVVAIKRANILMSCMLGSVMFKESILRRLPYVLLMIFGMTLVVIEPHGWYEAIGQMSARARLRL